VSAKTFQLAANTVYRNDEVLHSALQQLRSAAFMFVFGGTNFSRQWWAKNIVPYMLMARMADLPVYFGPQQYGPMTAEQQRRTQQFIHERVEGVRFRNPACMSELGMQGETEKLVRDEVFSNTQVYPVVEERSGRAASRKTVLVNFRGEQNFLSDDKSKARLDNLVAYLRGLHNRLDCKFTFFSVSGPEFCDDTECIGYVRQRLPRVEIDQLPYTNAKDHIEAARKAYATVSMSLHGCILSMIGGCPAVPITHGEYYNHKYVGFGKYNPNKNIPIYHVKNEPSSLVIKDSIKYFQNYDPKRVSKERKKSDKKIEKFYTKALNKYGFVEM
jgi:polysaccharide pyruvyl transferase WcaK-like protein